MLVWYRVQDVQYAPYLDEWDRPCGDGRVDVHVYVYPVLKTTPCGVWLDLGIGGKRFVLRDARKRFACPTEEEAYESFLARKRKQKRILEAQLRRVETAIQAAEKRDTALPF